MCDERPDILGMRRHEGQRIHRTAAAGEEVDGTADRLDDPMQVIGMLVGRRLGGRIGLRAALRPARVVRDQGAVGEVPREGAEAGGAHR